MIILKDLIAHLRYLEIEGCADMPVKLQFEDTLFNIQEENGHAKAYGAADKYVIIYPEE